jgi:exodeoxyribonuclease-3
LCLQEIKAKVGQVPNVLLDWVGHNGYLSYLNPSSLKAGHSGTAVFTRLKPLSVGQAIGLDRFDKEGRVLRLDFDKFTLFNFYMTHGDRTQKHMAFKLAAFDWIRKELGSFLKGNRVPLILVGDFNVAHKEIDLARPKDNQKNTGFTLPERAKIDKLLELGFVDSFRKFHKQGGHYTWWSNFRNARARNIGWRIDYCFVSQVLAGKLKSAFILPQVFGSDHCPLGIDIF